MAARVQNESEGRPRARAAHMDVVGHRPTVLAHHEKAAVDATLRELREKRLLNATARGGQPQVAWVALAARARLAGATHIDDIPRLPTAAGSTRTWVRSNGDLNLDAAQASRQLARWLALLEELDKQRVAAAACGQTGAGQSGALELLVGHWLGPEWHAVVLALSCRGVCRTLRDAASWADEARTREAAGPQPSCAGSESTVWRAWRRTPPRERAAATTASNHDVAIEACRVALAALHSHASGNRSRFWARVEEAVLARDDGLRVTKSINDLRDRDLVAAIGTVAPSALPVVCEWAGCEPVRGRCVAERAVSADVRHGKLVRDGIRAARVGLALYRAWSVTAFEQRALAAFRLSGGLVVSQLSVE